MSVTIRLSGGGLVRSLSIAHQFREQPWQLDGLGVVVVAAGFEGFFAVGWTWHAP